MILSIVVFCIFNESSKISKEKHFWRIGILASKDDYQNIVDNDKRSKKIKP